MAAVTPVKALTDFFNVGEGKRESKTWLAELKALTIGEKFELAAAVCAFTGDNLTLNGSYAQFATN